jgi:cytochrome c oxidase assembly protein subunit 15
MADPVWPTYPWHLLLVSWIGTPPGFLVEHSHRLAGYVVGCCGIALVISLWRTESRRWVCVLGTVALGAIIVQGLLGGFRVKLDQWLGADLAMVHGGFAPVVFSLLASVVLVTSRGWTAASATPPVFNKACRHLAVATTSLIYLQILFGALLRHSYSTWGARGHLLVAFCVAVSVAFLMRETVAGARGNWRAAVPAVALALLALLQIALGVEAWLLRVSVVGLEAQGIIRTGHVVVGYLMLANAVAVTLQVCVLSGTRARSLKISAAALGGAA